jgi:hypothetical protein
MLMFGNPCPIPDGPLTRRARENIDALGAWNWGPTLASRAGQVHLEPILLPIALNRTTMKVLIGIQTSNLLESEKNSATQTLARLPANWCYAVAAFSSCVARNG